ncbi:MAG: hypothetical protein ABSE28_20405, partial [Candidatus Sulfotelmatobacter sp.]
SPVTVGLISGFWFIGSRLCCTLPSGPASRRVSFHPCALLTPRSPSDWVEDFHLPAVAHARHTKKKSAGELPALTQTVTLYALASTGSTP